MLIIVFGICVILVSLLILSRSSSVKRELSDHFDGKKFYNPTLNGKPATNITDVFRLLQDRKTKWPDHVENRGTPQLDGELAPGEIRITFINHATFLIQFHGLTILTDPVWSSRVSPLSWAGPGRVREPGVKIEDLPHVDVIVVSHNHYDHLDIATLKKLNKRFSPKVLVPVGDKRLVESIGIKDVHELDWWDYIETQSGIRFTFAPTQHGSARGLHDRDRSLWGSYFIQSKTQSVYFGGDAAYSTHYIDIKNRLGSPTIALLGIGAYAPQWFMQPAHMNPAEAVVAHKDLGAKLSIGMHYGTFQLSSEAIDQPTKDLEEALKNHDIPAECFVTLEEGETRIW